MRFAAGMLCGILLTFSGAAALDVEGLPTLLRQQAAGLWSTLSSSGPEPVAPVEAPAAVPTPSSPPVAQTDLTPVAPAVSDPASTEPAAAEPSTAEPAVQETAAGGPSAVEAKMLEAETAAPSGLAAEVPEAVADGRAADSQAPGGPGTQFVWQAFRSEMSARGFARQLEATVNHHLEVHKAGPGRYLVGFQYESAAERETVLQAMAELMGTQR